MDRGIRWAIVYGGGKDLDMLSAHTLLKDMNLGFWILKEGMPLSSPHK